MAQCERLGGDAARAAIAFAIFAGKERTHELGYKLADSPFEEPEIVRAAWLWNHLNSDRTNPRLSDEDLKRLLQIPSMAEGFQRLFYVTIAAGGGFVVEEWRHEV